MLLGELQQFLRTHHGAVLAHYLTAKSRLGESCQTAEVNGCLGMARTYEHATIASLQREHVARTTEVDRLRRRVGYGTRRNATLYGRDAGGGRDMVNADGEGRLMVVAIVHHHLREVKAFAELTAHRHADESLGKRCHKIDILCSGELRRTDKIALVLTIGVVDDKYALACTESLKGFVYRIIISHSSCFMQNA